MKRIILPAMLLASPVMAQTAPQPITLSAEEYQQIITTLAQRDPIIAGLIQKQVQAQEAAKKAAPAPAK